MMSERMKGNDWLEDIRNHEVSAPADIMERAIQKSNRKRFFAFHWSSMNVWYWSVIVLSLGGWGFYSMGNAVEETKSIHPSSNSSTSVVVPMNVKGESNVALSKSIVEKNEIPVTNEISSFEASNIKRIGEDKQDNHMQTTDMERRITTNTDQVEGVSNVNSEVHSAEQKSQEISIIPSTESPILNNEVSPEGKSAVTKNVTGKSKKLAVKVFGKP